MIDLKPFCYAEDCSIQYPAIRNPFAQGDWVYATDLRIAVQVPVADYPDIKPPEGDAPPMGKHKTWTLFDEQRQWTPLAAPAEPEYEPCPECGRPDSKYRDYCTATMIDGWPYSVGYLHLASRLPGVEYALVPWKNGSLMLLRFDGGQGILIGMEREDTE